MSFKINECNFIAYSILTIFTKNVQMHLQLEAIFAKNENGFIHKFKMKLFFEPYVVCEIK
jgi:hypothetical protein